ncbi:MAG: arginase family protein [Vulcanisaeta sp. AZ3]
MSSLEFYVNGEGTFFGIPKCGSGVPIIGIPMEDTVSFRPGTRFAPNVVRQWSQYFEFTPSVDLGIDVLSKACDLGDVSLLQGFVEKNLGRIEEVISEALGRWGRVVSIGGEHTISLGVARGIKSAQSSYGIYIHVDAHLDSRLEWPPGQPLSHATFVRHIISSLNPQLALFFGARVYDPDEVYFVNNLENAMLLRTRDIKLMSKYELRLWIRNALDSYSGPVHLSIDADSLDPAIMPGVGNPESFGLSYDDLLRIVEAVLDYGSSRVKAVDIVEYSPPNDPGLMSLPTIIRLILDVLNYL